MVSGSRCPAGSEPVEKWIESRAAAPKGRTDARAGAVTKMADQVLGQGQ